MARVASSRPLTFGAMRDLSRRFCWGCFDAGPAVRGGIGAQGGCHDCTEYCLGRRPRNECEVSEAGKVVVGNLKQLYGRCHVRVHRHIQTREHHSYLFGVSRDRPYCRTGNVLSLPTRCGNCHSVPLHKQWAKAPSYRNSSRRYHRVVFQDSLDLEGNGSALRMRKRTT